MKIKLPVSKRVIGYIVLAFSIHFFAYFGTRLFTKNLVHHDITTGFDGLFPLLPWTLIIYFGCYVFWVVNYILAALQEEEEAVRFYKAYALATAVCAVIYVVFPTTNVRPEIVGEDFFSKGMRFLYSIDDPDNLFPSIHCMCSWFCVIAVRKQAKVPAWYKWTSVVLAFLVFFSTLATKQHVVVDVIAGVAVAEGSYFAVKRVKR